MRKFEQAGVLEKAILIGSWCTLFYKDYFGKNYTPVIKTRDIDFLLPQPKDIKIKTDIFELIKEFGFIIDFSGEQGYIRLMHPDLIVEFLVPEKGRGTSKPYPLPQLGLNAQALRYMELLISNTIKCNFDNIIITMPHPVNYALHKLLIMQKRQQKDKAAKDREDAIRIIKSLVRKGEEKALKQTLLQQPIKWQNLIKKSIGQIDDEEIKNLLGFK